MKEVLVMTAIGEGLFPPMHFVSNDPGIGRYLIINK